jgi:hypothetical protein
MQTVEILSANPAVTLKFSDFDGNYLVVSFDSPTIQIAVRVYASKDSGLGDMAALVDLFKTMNDNWKGWGGELSWVSLEGEFGIVATADSSGHVSLRLKFQEISGPAPCSADIDFTLEAMQVEQAHRKLAHLFLRE